MSYISDIRTDSHFHKKDQKDSFAWLAREWSRHSTKTEANFLALLERVGAKPPQVLTRGHYLPEFKNIESERLLFRVERPPVLEERMRCFEEISLGLFDRLLKNTQPMGQLFHVTCTGYVSPSPAQKWLLQAGLHQKARVHHLYHMGCYAALPAIRQAHAFADQSERVEICHTELCTLHLNPRDPSLEEMVVQSLFADGGCAYTVTRDKPRAPALRYIDTHEEILPESASAMSWGLAQDAFNMTLSKDVPTLVKKSLPEILERWLGEKQAGGDSARIWAIHPGGPRIIDEIQQLFELKEDQVKYSRKVLRERGNMSSATLPHIWAEILLDENVPSGTRVLTMAFGPGLTVSLGQLEVAR